MNDCILVVMMLSCLLAETIDDGTNASVSGPPCRALPNADGKRTTNPNDELIRLLRDKGGDFIPQYMAADQFQAAKHFSNLLTMSTHYTDPLAKHHVFDQVRDNAYTSCTLYEDMKRLRSANWDLASLNNVERRLNTAKSSTKRTSPPVVSTNSIDGLEMRMRNTKSIDYKNVLNVDEASSSERVTYARRAHNVKRDYVESVKSFSKHSMNGNSPESIKYVYDMNSLVNKPHRVVDEVPMADVRAAVPFSTNEASAPGLLENDCSSYINNIERPTHQSRSRRTPRFRRQANLLRKMVKPEQAGIKDSLIIGPDAARTQVEYCLLKGSLSDDGFLHMCTSCAATTTLPVDRFPRVINEAVCVHADPDCLTVNGIPHGQCKQKVFHVNMLKKSVGKCHISDKNGTMGLTDWELYTQPIRVGCECMIDSRSLFAPYIKMP